MRIRIVLSALLFALGAGAIAAGVLADARDARLQSLLVEIETAEERIPHAGTRVLEAREWSVVLRVAAEGGRRRVEILEAPGMKAPSGRSANARIPYLAGFPPFLRPGHGQWRRKVKDYGLALRNYEIEVTGRQVVAGREADLLEIRPRRGGRPGYRIAADADNRFPLRFEVLSGGERVFLAGFQDIAYGASVPEGGPARPRWPSWLRVEREEVPFVEVPRRVGYGIWAPARLPAGFELRRSALVRVRVDIPEEMRQGLARLLFPIPRLEARVAHFDYTDGIAVLSVVECPAKSELWRVVRRLVGGDGAEGPEGRVVARRFADRGGSAFFLEVGDTAILAAGNVEAGEIEEMIRTLERR